MGNPAVEPQPRIRVVISSMYLNFSKASTTDIFYNFCLKKPIQFGDS